MALQWRWLRAEDRVVIDFILTTRQDRQRAEHDVRRWPDVERPADAMWKRGRAA